MASPNVSIEEMVRVAKLALKATHWPDVDTLVVPDGDPPGILLAGSVGVEPDEDGNGWWVAEWTRYGGCGWEPEDVSAEPIHQEPFPHYRAAILAAVLHLVKRLVEETLFEDAMEQEIAAFAATEATECKSP